MSATARFLCLGILGLIFFATKSFGQISDTISTGRPGASHGADVVGTGVLQLQSGLIRSNDNSFPKVKTTTVENVVRYGLNEKYELSTTFNLVKNDIDQRGIDSFQIGGRVNLISKSDGIVPAIGLQGRLALKGTGDFKRDERRPQFSLAFSHDLPKGFNLTTNFLMGYDGINPKANYGFTSALSYSINERWGVFIEEYGNYQNEWSMYFDTGASYLVNKNLMVDLSIGKDTDSDIDQTFINLGLSIRTM